MLNIKLGNIKEFDSLYLHDARLINIKCDYNLRSVIIELDVSKVRGTMVNVSKEAKLKFVNVYYISLGLMRPWGGYGENIVDWNAQQYSLSRYNKYMDTQTNPKYERDLSKSFTTIITTNAGDSLEVLAEEINYETDD